MSDGEDILGEDLGDHSLADYNIGNEEEEQLLADDYERGESQNVPASIGTRYEDVPEEYSGHRNEYNTQVPPPYQPSEPECVVPNITVEVPNVPTVTGSDPLPTYAPYPERPYENEHAVPPAIPAGPAVTESPQIVPSELPHPGNEVRDRFISERPPGAQRLPQVRDIPDSLDKVMVPRGSFPQRGRSNTWRNPQLRRGHPYRHNTPRGNFMQRQSFPPPQLRPPMPLMRPEMRPEIIRPLPPPIQQELPPERPMIPLDMQFRPDRPFQHSGPRFPNQFRPRLDEPRPNFIRPNFEPRPMFNQQPMFNQRPPFGPHIREIAPNMGPVPQVTIRPPNPMQNPKGPEVRMLPVQLPPNLPPGGLQGKKVLINPHFKGNFQPPEGPIKDIDDAAERFIAEQRNALAKAANRKPPPRRSPQRYIENTTIEIENDLARNSEEDQDLLRRQQEFIQSNRDGLRRRMRSPPSTIRRSPERRRVRTRSRSPPPLLQDEESEYRRRVREQENLRERVLRAKEVRRRKNAVALHKQLQEREKERQEQKSDPKDKPIERPVSPPKIEEKRPEPKIEKPSSPELVKPDTTRKSPEREVDKERARERSPVKKDSEVNSTCENLTPPRPLSRGHTPPLPRRKLDSDDELELILDDIDGILSDDEDSPRLTTAAHRPEPPKSKASVDLRSKLATKQTQEKPRNKIVFSEDKSSRREKSPATAKSPPRRTVVTSSTKTEQSERKFDKVKSKSEVATNKSRQRITFDTEKESQKEKEDIKSRAQFTNRRVILQRKVNNSPPDRKDKTQKVDPSKPNAGIFSRAVRTAIGTENRIIIKKIDDTQIEYDSSSDTEENKSSESIANVASVTNLPHGMTDTRLKTLAGSEVQNLILNKEGRSAKITFKSSAAAEHFKKKFNNKMVAASRVTVTLR